MTKFSLALTRTICASLIAAAFLATMFQAAKAQTPRIPTPGADGTFSDFQVDGDRIKILTQTLDTAPADAVAGKIRIRLESDSSWWRMLRVRDKNGIVHSLEEEDGHYFVTRGDKEVWIRPNRSSLIEIDTKDLNDTFKIEFWKGKALNVHTFIMSETYRKSDFESKYTTFNWRDGLEDGYSDQYENGAAPISESFMVDGRKVTITSAPGGTPYSATIKFSTGIAWWTGLKTIDVKGKSRMISKVDGKYRPESRTILLPSTLLPKEVKLEFWTAKAFGVHTLMRTRKFVRERFYGRVVTITWG